MSINPEDFTVEQLKQILEAKLAELEEGVEKQDAPEQQASVSEDFSVMRKEDNTSKRKVRGGENTWVDTGEHRDVETPDVDLTPRKRKSPRKIEKVCHVCGRKSKVRADMISGEFYRCDYCTGR